ncbi:MAG TPA: SRPBCC domain-containing protein [Gemmatimonadaceae bacterium]|nr:SRPBCC domain-containing protein [Gemmatimonadaceae bacterium]
MSRVVRVPPERAFAVWTDPNEIVRWWGPAGVTCPESHIDLRVGGEYRIANQFADGRVVWIRGTFEAIDPPHSLIYSWHLEAEPHASADERVTVRFEPLAGGATTIVVIHERIGDAARRESHAIGWAGCLDGFVAHLARARVPELIAHSGEAARLHRQWNHEVVEPERETRQPPQGEGI